MNSTHAASQCTCGSNAMPEVTFATFIMSLASSTLVQLGEVPNPENNEYAEDLVLAKHSIDVLTMLQEKTRRCLTAEETQMLDALLYELRLKFVMKKRQ